MSRKALVDSQLESGAQPSLGDALSRRVNADPESVERGLAQLVLTIVELRIARWTLAAS
jgi:hypothetical protein